MTEVSRRTLIFLHPSDELYGADRMLMAMLRALPDGTEAEVWLPNDLEHPAQPLCAQLERDGHRVRHEPLPIMRRAYRSPRGIAGLALRAQRLRRDLRRVAPAMVYCTTSAAFLGAPTARLAGVPRVVGHVQEIWSRGDSAILSRAAAACHQVLTISNAVRDALPSRIRNRATVVLNGVDDPPPARPLESHSGTLHYLVASRWNGWKGHLTLLTAWERAGAPGHLTVLGGPPLSGERVDVPGAVARLRRPESVSLVGEVADPAPYLDAADVVVLPSDDPEPFGLVAIEAFARGRPVVASAAGGPLEIITDGRDGWLFAPRNSDSLVHLLARLTREEVLAAGRAGRKTYEERFTYDRWAHDWQTAVFDVNSVADTTRTEP